LYHRIDSTEEYETGSARFQENREEIGSDASCREAALSLEINTEHESRLMAFEINEIEG
jgi:hypothetical protein